MRCSDLELLLEKYADATSKEEIYIKRTLEDIAKLFDVCEESEYYYADLITRNFCRVIEMMEKQRKKEMVVAQSQADRTMRFQNDRDLAQAFYNHFKEDWQVDYLEIGDAQQTGRKELVNPTMKDYVARIYTFAGKKYLGEMFRPEELGGMDPVLFTYENLELILATFQTRDAQGQIVKQRVNIRSALRKLNEFKQRQER